jgi:hypothetical protein
MTQNLLPPPAPVPLNPAAAASMPERLPPAPTTRRITPRWVIAGAGASFGLVIAAGTALPWATSSTEAGRVVVDAGDVVPDDVRILMFCAGATAIAFLLTALTRSASFLVLALGATFLSGALAWVNISQVVQHEAPYDLMPGDPRPGAGLIVVATGSALALLAAFFAGAEYRRIGRQRRTKVDLPEGSPI